MTKLNQTAEKFLRNFENSIIPVKGIGLFVLRTNGNLKKHFQYDITYEKAAVLGEESIAFKFIPYNETIKVHGRNFLLRNKKSIPAKHWVCSGACSNTIDCNNISEVCICAEGQCL